MVKNKELKDQEKEKEKDKDEERENWGRKHRGRKRNNGENTGAVGSKEDCFEELWKLKIPSKIAVFAWRLFRDRLSTKKNLQRRQVQIMDLSCPFCGCMEEEASHLFIHCMKIQPIWWETMSWMNIKSVSIKPKTSFPPTFICSGGWHKGQEMAMVVDGCSMVHLADAK